MPISEQKIFRGCYVFDGHPVAGWGIPSDWLPEPGDVKQSVTNTGRFYQQLYTDAGWIELPYRARLQALTEGVLLARPEAVKIASRIVVEGQVWIRRIGDSRYWYPDTKCPYK